MRHLRLAPNLFDRITELLDEDVRVDLTLIGAPESGEDDESPIILPAVRLTLVKALNFDPRDANSEHFVRIMRGDDSPPRTRSRVLN
jgi:hypothetical protein